MIILGTNSIKDTGYNVANSCRFNDGSSDHMLKTASAGNRRTFTFSTWLKLSQLTTARYLFTSWSANNDAGFTYLSITDGDKIKFAGYGTTYLETTQLLRDPSSWYHLMLAVNTTSGTANNRCRIYLNGSEITSFGTRNNPSQNADLAYNQNSVDLVLASNNYGGSKGNYFDGYLAETVLIDGQQLAPDQFGEFDEDSGIWKPIDVSGLTFGTNGFYLDFENSGALGADVSGNSNNFTVNNLTAIDQTTDTPTNNFCTINPLENYNSSFTLSEGNLKAVTTNYSFIRSTIGVASGKWYMEVKCTAQTSNTNKWSFGISDVPASSSTQCLGDNSYEYTWRGDANTIFYNGSSTTYGSDGGMSTGMIVGIALDLDNNKIYWSRNGTWRNSADPSAGTNGFSIVAPSSTNNGFYHFTFGECDGTYNFTFETNYGNPPLHNLIRQYRW